MRMLVRFAEVHYEGYDGGRHHARRGEVIDLHGIEAARLVALGALVPPGTDISPPVDDRPWEDVLQEAANARYDWAPVIPLRPRNGASR
jgi:hypothetical protein